MNNDAIVKIGTTELYFEDAFKIYQEDKYIVNYSGVWQLFYSQAQNQVYGKKVYSYKGLTMRGRFFIKDGNAVNNLIGFNHFN